VRIVAELILDKMLGCSRLADVVIKSSDAGEESIAADYAAGFFRQLPDRV
jgi:hypothetical protein